VGDTVEVHYLIREGDKERVQLFIGTIIALKGRGIRRSITVRRIVQGEGVERIFPLHSPRVKDVVITRRGEVRRAKLYFLRDRVGKQTKVKELLGEKVRKEREFEKAMRAASSVDADGAASEPAPGKPEKPEKQVAVKVCCAESSPRAAEAWPNSRDAEPGRALGARRRPTFARSRTKKTPVREDQDPPPAMNENTGRKSLLTIVLVVLAIAAIVGPLLFGQKPFRLGLDLQGGTRLVYKFDFDAALHNKQITQAEYNRKSDLLQETITIIHGRVDPKGVMELSLRPEGEDKIEIELPGAAEVQTSKVLAKLAKPVAADPNAPEGKVIELVSDASNVQVIKAFPLGTGEITIGSEKMVYSSRSGAVLNVQTRGSEGTAIAAHTAGDTVELGSTDDLQKLIENVGDMQFLIGAKPADLTPLGTDISKEQKKMEDWRKANPNTPIDVFNRLTPEQGGPVTDLRWHPHLIKASEAEVSQSQRQPIPLMVPRPKDPGADRDAWIFTGADLESVMFSQDPRGSPAVGFEMSTDKKRAFGDFTEAHINDGMAIVLNGEIATLANINSKLPGGGIIEGGAGGFTTKEVQDLITVLRSGSLKIKPVLLDKARVGATLGDDYIKKSLISSLVAMALVVGFMVFFYRRLGLFSVIGLALNVVLLLGALAFLRATLTLPGVAGVILTLGMAVDSNILIYERLREEMNRGVKLVQGVKAAFERAAVTIIDSHVTQLIAGVILYYVGTGPIRGFATTLNIGILTTLFTVLVVTEVLVLRDVKRGTKTYHMIKVLEKPKVAFMSVAKYAIGVSVVLIVAGLWLFISLPAKDKLGMDFLGGFTVTVRTQEPQQKETVRELLKQVPGALSSASVIEIVESGSRDKGYTTFRITYKLEGDETKADQATGQSSQNEVKNALKSILQREQVEVALTPGEGGSKVKGEIYLEDDHPSADIAAKIAATDVTKVELAPLAGHPHSFAFTGEAAAGRTADEVQQTLERAFTNVKDSTGKPYRLMSALPESAFIGPQVGGELRDKAVLAVLLSLLGTILYLRIRFAEYGYGVAVVVSLVHDVLIAIGALAVAVKWNLLQAEIDLSMIAAFLTIIGYSQNDTIVIFDRVRENRPKSKKPLEEVLNDSINECLGRTILTTATVVLTLIVLFAFNIGTRNVLEGFSYCMLVGVISGAYSTIYVASPVLLWFERRAAKKHLGTPTEPRATAAAGA
jgi:SecD/SecF fusion protein